jgi:hypothetical protein
MLCTLEGTVGNEARRAIGDLSLGSITPMPIEGLHQHRNAGVVFDHSVQHHLVEIRALIATIAAGEVHDGRLGLLVTVVAPIDMKARTIEMGKAGRKAQALGSSRGNEAVEFRHPRSRRAYLGYDRACHRGDGSLESPAR